MFLGITLIKSLEMIWCNRCCYFRARPMGQKLSPLLSQGVAAAGPKRPDQNHFFPNKILTLARPLLLGSTRIFHFGPLWPEVVIHLGPPTALWQPVISGLQRLSVNSPAILARSRRHMRDTQEFIMRPHICPHSSPQ